MPRLTLLCAIYLFSLFNETKAQDAIDSTSYSVGMGVAYRLQSQGASNLNYESMMRGIKDVLNNNSLLIERDESEKINYLYFNNQKTQMLKEEGANFLAENGKRPEVITTESGLQYEVLTPAEGPKPTGATTVTVHYVGKLISGEMFDSSVDRGEPISFPLNRVIPGWTEGLQLMSAGAKYRFFIPEHLGYGSRGAGQAIPPYSALIFDVDLLSF